MKLLAAMVLASNAFYDSRIDYEKYNRESDQVYNEFLQRKAIDRLERIEKAIKQQRKNVIENYDGTIEIDTGY
ncbi:MAG: hypothetical protein ACREBU_00810 [Nitrososphaera sp.]